MERAAAGMATAANLDVLRGQGFELDGLDSATDLVLAARGADARQRPRLVLPGA